MDQLVMRNIHLEAELQLARIRAMQAEAILPHLDNREIIFAGLPISHSIARLTLDVQMLRDEVSYLKQQLKIRRERCETPKSSHDIFTGLKSSTLHPNVHNQDGQSSKIENVCKVQGSPVKRVHDNQFQIGVNTALGGMNLNGTGFRHHTASDSASPCQPYHSPNQTSLIDQVDTATPSNRCLNPSTEVKTRVHLSPHRHNALSGSAIYIEDMEDTEKEAFWEQQARKYDFKVSSKQLKDYYETEIRPRYVARTGQNDEDASPRMNAETDTRMCTAPDSIPKGPEAESSFVPAARGSMLSCRSDYTLQTAGLLASRWADRMHTRSSDKPVALQKAEDQRDGDAEPNSWYPDSSAEELHKAAVSDITGSSSRREAPEIAAEHRHAVEDSRRFDISNSMSENSSSQQKVDDVPASSAIVQSHQSLFEPQNGVDNADIQKALVSVPTRHGAGRPAETVPHRCTVVIGDVPTGVKLVQVVDNICGGGLRSAAMLQTAGMRTRPCIETNTVWLIFLEPEGARLFAQSCALTPLVFVDGNNNLVPAEVTHLKTPTSGLGAGIRQQMGRKRQLTRVLYMNDPNQQWTPERVIEELRHLSNRTRHQVVRDPERHGLKHLLALPLRKGKTVAGLLYFEYASLREAELTFDLITSSTKEIFGDVECGFLPDPCDRSCETRRATQPEPESPLIHLASSECDGEE